MAVPAQGKAHGPLSGEGPGSYQALSKGLLNSMRSSTKPVTPFLPLSPLAEASLFVFFAC